MKYLGAQHGVLIAAAAGGLASSTAVAATNAKRAGAGEGEPRLLAAGVSLANAVSWMRVVAILAVLNPACCRCRAAAGRRERSGVAYAVVSVYWRGERKADRPR